MQGKALSAKGVCGTESGHLLICQHLRDLERQSQTLHTQTRTRCRPRTCLIPCPLPKPVFLPRHVPSPCTPFLPSLPGDRRIPSVAGGRAGVRCLVEGGVAGGWRPVSGVRWPGSGGRCSVGWPVAGGRRGGVAVRRYDYTTTTTMTKTTMTKTTTTTSPNTIFVA